MATLMDPMRLARLSHSFPWRFCTSLFALLALIEHCSADPKILERYEQQLNNLHAKSNGGKPMIVNGRIKRFRCIEEYVYVDALGNVIESSTTVPIPVPTPLPTPVNNPTPMNLGSLLSPNTNRSEGSTEPNRTSSPLALPMKSLIPPSPSLNLNLHINTSSAERGHINVTRVGESREHEDEFQKELEKSGRKPVSFGLPIHKISDRSDERRKISRKSTERDTRPKGSREFPVVNELEYPDYSQYYEDEIIVNGGSHTKVPPPTRDNRRRTTLPLRRGQLMVEPDDEYYLDITGMGNHRAKMPLRRFPGVMQRRRPIDMPYGESFGPDEEYLDADYRYAAVRKSKERARTQGTKLSGIPHPPLRNLRRQERLARSRSAARAWARAQQHMREQRIKQLSHGNDTARQSSEEYRPFAAKLATAAYVPSPKEESAGTKRSIEPPPTIPKPPTQLQSPIVQKMNSHQSLPNPTPAGVTADPLQMSPENCMKVSNYARLFGVSNPQNWVRNNCPFVQTFVKASCEDINTFIDSCFVKKKTTNSDRSTEVHKQRH